MSYIEAVKTARAKGADYVAYKNLAQRVVVAVKAGAADVSHAIANVDREGLNLIAAGISASRKSLYDFDAGQFICGTVAQLAPNGEA